MLQLTLPLICAAIHWGPLPWKFVKRTKQLPYQIYSNRIFPYHHCLSNWCNKDYVICLPPGANLIRDSNVKNKSETNSVIEVTQNGTFSFRFPFMKVYCLCLYVDILPLVVVSYCSCIFKLSKKQGLSQSDWKHW